MQVRILPIDRGLEEREGDPEIDRAEIAEQEGQRLHEARRRLVERELGEPCTADDEGRGADPIAVGDERLAVDRALADALVDEGQRHVDLGPAVGRREREDVDGRELGQRLDEGELLAERHEPVVGHDAPLAHGVGELGDLAHDELAPIARRRAFCRDSRDR